MKFRLPPNAFPPLSLSRDEKRWLRDEMNAVVAETMRSERQFVNPEDGRAVFPKKDWKEVRARDDFSVYKQRRASKRRASSQSSSSSSDPAFSSAPPSGGAAAGAFSSSQGFAGVRTFSVDSMDDMGAPTSTRSISTASGAWTSGSNEDQDSIVAAMKEPHVPLLVASGTMDGTLDDTTFGALAGDDVAWRVRTAYVKDKFADARILAKIDGPTAEDPFRSLCVKWFTKELPAIVGSFIQRRDFLILEATGTGVESDGTRFGYYMLHSIKLPGVPELSDLNVIRCKVSLCFISRQLTSRSTHLFARGFSDARGEMLETVGVALTAESIIAATLVIECATVKKLTWLMQKKQRQRLERMQRVVSSAQSTECDSCHRPAKKLSLSKNLHSCQACGIMACAKCSVQKRIIIDVSGDGVVDRSLTFCFGCMMEAKRLSSWDVATDLRVVAEQRHPQQQRQRQRQRHQSLVQKSLRADIARSQSLDFDAVPRASAMYSPDLRPSVNFSASNPMDGGRDTTVRPHASKSVAGGGIILY